LPGSLLTRYHSIRNPLKKTCEKAFAQTNGRIKYIPSTTGLE